MIIIRNKAVIMTACILVVMLFSCESMSIDEKNLGAKRVEVSIAPDANGEVGLSSLSYTVCLFRADLTKKQSVVNTDYKLVERKDNLTKSQVDTYNITVDNAGMEAGRYSYQLFIHATPSMPETKVTDMITNISSIEDIEIAAISSKDGYISLSKDNYCALKELDPKDIYAGVYLIKVPLKRLVGQLVFDFFKCDPVTKLPVDIDNPYQSTLDRVEMIEIMASGITTKIKPFSRTLVKSEASITSLLIYPHLSDDYTLDVSVQNPQIMVPITTKDNVESIGGGVRMFTTYLLPTGDANGSSILKTNLIFHYYDTTPLYSTTPVTYDKRIISLNIPSEGKELTVIKNCYTVTNIRLINNRIIDINVNAPDDITINTDWAKNE